MSAYDIWRIATAMNMHFSGNYDAFKFNFKAKHLSVAAFENRRDKYHYIKLEKVLINQQECIDYFFANRMYNKQEWVGSMTSDPLTLYKKTLQSMPYKFKQDLANFDSVPFNDILFKDQNSVPPIVQSWLSDEIHLETILIIQILTNFVSLVDVRETLFWPEIKKDLLNAAPFIKHRIKNIIRYRNTIINRELNNQ